MIIGIIINSQNMKKIEKRRKKHARLIYQEQSLPLQREFGRIALP
jgi:hypothetical protein